MSNLTNQVVNQVLEEVKNVYKEHGRLTDEIISLLNYTFKEPLAGAFALLDKNSITKISSPSGRKLYQVAGSSGLLYTCLPSSNYCSCQAYKYSVLVKQDHPMCKHVLAVQLSSAMECYKEVNFADSTLTVMLEELD